SISNSVIAGNRVTAGEPVDVCSDGYPCSFTSGGGIANWGTLTVTNTLVDGNVAGATANSGGLATDARGGAIWNAHQGTLTLRHSVVTDNRAAVTPPNGHFVEGGGIADEGTLNLEDSTVSANHADVASAVESSFPFDYHQEAV